MGRIHIILAYKKMGIHEILTGVICYLFRATFSAAFSLSFSFRLNLLTTQWNAMRMLMCKLRSCLDDYVISWLTEAIFDTTQEISQSFLLQSLWRFFPFHNFFRITSTLILELQLIQARCQMMSVSTIQNRVKRGGKVQALLPSGQRRGLWSIFHKKLRILASTESFLKVRDLCSPEI